MAYIIICENCQEPWKIEIFLFLQKQVKINAAKIERCFGVVMTPFSSSKMIQINCQE